MVPDGWRAQESRGALGQCRISAKSNNSNFGGVFAGGKKINPSVPLASSGWKEMARTKVGTSFNGDSEKLFRAWKSLPVSNF